MMNFETSFRTRKFKNGTSGRVLNLVDSVDHLDLGVNQTMLVFEEWRKITATDPTIFVDCGHKRRAPVLPVPGGVVATAAKKRNSEWGLTDDH
jgi:hypothetical protein